MSRLTVMELMVPFNPLMTSGLAKPLGLLSGIEASTMTLVVRICCPHPLVATASPSIRIKACFI
jgi:hypothetical protein